MKFLKKHKGKIFIIIFLIFTTYIIFDTYNIQATKDLQETSNHKIETVTKKTTKEKNIDK